MCPGGDLRVHGPVYHNTASVGIIKLVSIGRLTRGFAQRPFTRGSQLFSDRGPL